MFLKKKISTEEEEPKTYSIRIRRAQLHRDLPTSFCQAATSSPHSWCDWFGLHWYRETDDALQMIWRKWSHGLALEKPNLRIVAHGLAGVYLNGCVVSVWIWSIFVLSVLVATVDVVGLCLCLNVVVGVCTVCVVVLVVVFTYNIVI